MSESHAVPESFVLQSEQSLSPIQATAVEGSLEASEEFRAVLAMTERLFPGSVTVRRKQDPEFAEEYVVFAVHACGDFDDIMSRDSQWHRECIDLAPSVPHLYRLSINIAP